MGNTVEVTFSPAEGSDWFEIYVEVMALIAALQEYGRDLGDPETHLVAAASYDLHALMRLASTARSGVGI